MEQDPDVDTFASARIIPFHPGADWRMYHPVDQFRAAGQFRGFPDPHRRRIQLAAQRIQPWKNGG